MTVESMWKRAIVRALANGGAAAVTRIRFGLYSVGSSSRPGTRHTVRMDTQGRYRCTCEASRAGRPVCWHRANVYLAKVEHGGGRVADPAVAPAPAPLPANVPPSGGRPEQQRPKERVLSVPAFKPCPRCGETFCGGPTQRVGFECECKAKTQRRKGWARRSGPNARRAHAPTPYQEAVAHGDAGLAQQALRGELD